MGVHLDGQLTCPGSQSKYIVILFSTQISASSHPRVPFPALVPPSSLGPSFLSVE